MTRPKLDADYYQTLHENHPAFRNNNWMTQDLVALRAIAGESLLELGCGNGLFLEIACEYWPTVMGVDWARSPVLEDVLRRMPQIMFERADLLSWQAPQRFDLVVSADFLEHLPPDHLISALRGFHSFGANHFHRIACYDDGHSHLSIHSPETWVQIFETAVPGGYRLLTSEARKGNPDKLVITVGSFAEVGARQPDPRAPAVASFPGSQEN